MALMEINYRNLCDTLHRQNYEKREKIKQLEADKERLDFLDSLNGKYTGKIILRMSSHGRGFRLHETSMGGASTTVREAIDSYIKVLETK